MSPKSAVAGLIVIVLSAPAIMSQTTVVVPNEWENVEAPGVNSGWLAGDPLYQQVYAADEVGSGTIVEIRLRQDSIFGRAFSDPLYGLTVSLSSTPLAPDELRANPPDNVGPDVTVVFSGDLVWTGNTHPGEPWPFEIAIPLSTGFVFDSTAGSNLLLELRFTSWIVDPVFFDAVSEGGDAVSRLWCDPSDVCEPDSLGLITQFVFLPDEIFEDGFEDGTTGAWSSTVNK